VSAKRTERLLTLVILLLSSKRGYSKEELFEEIELYGEAPTPAAREKLFDRDKAMLREQGIPLEAFSEDPLFETDNTVQRYRINAEEYQLSGVTFTAEEYTFLSLAAGMWDPASLDSAASRAIRKLSTRTLASDAAARVPVQPRIQTNEPYWDEVWHAMAARRTIAFTYRAASTGREERRTVRPWGMGSRFGHWYLVGFDTDRQAERFFRLSRMTSAPVQLDGAFEPPASFDINTALASLTRRDPQGSAVLLVRPGTCNLLRVRRGSTVTETGEEWDRLEVPFTSLPALAADIAGFGTNAAVVEPAELGAQVRALLDGALEAARSAPRSVVFSSVPGGTSRRKSSAQDHLLRLLDLVPYLLARPGADLKETAHRFGVSEAQLTRDLDLLFVSGPRHYPDGLMDVDVDGGRIYLSNARNLSQPVRLAMDEACTLIVGLQALRDLPGIEASPALASAQAKLTAAAGDAARMGTVVATRLSEDEVHPTLELFQEALRRGVQVEMAYLVPARDEISSRLIEPIRAFSQGDLWYVEAWCTGSGGIRNFRLDRIQSARLTDRAAGGAGLSGASGAGTGPGTLYTPAPEDRSVTLVLHAPARWIAARYNAERAEEQPDGTLAAELRVGSTAWLPGLLAGLGGAAAVVHPEDVRREVLQWLEAAAGSGAN
jgi:predicted DNA-binding transcriptional regulator YafY